MNRSSLFLFIPVIFWGISYIAIKVVLAELAPVEMISIRFLLAAPTLFFILKIKKIPLWPVSMKGKLIIASAVVFFHFWIMAVGMLETSASNTAWILTTAPIFIAILSRFYLKESFLLFQWLGLILSCAGVFALVYNGDADNLGWLQSRGDIIVLGSCVTWGLYTVGTREITRKVDPLVATFYITLIAGLVFVPYTLYQSDLSRFTALTSNAIISLLFLGICCLALAFWLWSEGLKRQPAAEVGVWLYIEPLITVVAAWVLIDESITLWLLLGAVLISSGVYVSERFGRIKMIEHDV